jgi:hypothetical protein
MKFYNFLFNPHVLANLRKLSKVKLGQVNYVPKPYSKLTTIN